MRQPHPRRGLPRPTFRRRLPHLTEEPTMSLQPLRITAGRRLAAGLAGIITMSATLTSGFALAALAFLPAGSEGLLSEKFLFSALAVIVALVSATISFLLVLAALGRFCTGGSLSRFFRYQLAALGAGGGLGLGFAPAMTDAAPVWWVIAIAAALGLIAVSLLAFRKARYPILERPPPRPEHRGWQWFSPSMPRAETAGSATSSSRARRCRARSAKWSTTATAPNGSGASPSRTSPWTSVRRARFERTLHLDRITSPRCRPAISRPGDAERSPPTHGRLGEHFCARPDRSHPLP